MLPSARAANPFLRRRRFLAAAATGSLGLLALGRGVLAYPDGSVRIIVPFAPGGATDVIARIVAQKLSEQTKQSFYVENRPGAGGRIGTDFVAHATPDGSVILVVGSGFVVNPALSANLPYDPIKDFAPVTVVASSPNVMVVNPSVPAKTISELVALARVSPTKLSFASPGTGTLPYLCGELFKLTFHLDLVHVPFIGAGPAIAATLAGQTPIAFVPVPDSVEFIRSGALWGLGVTAEKRADVLPQIPTMTEAGAPGIEAETIQGVLVPGGTPQPIVDRLYDDINHIVRDPDVAARFAQLGFQPVGNTPAQFAAFIKNDIEKWTKVVRAAGMIVQ